MTVVAFNVHEFLKNRINKSAPFWQKTFPPIIKSLSTGPTINEHTMYYIRSITITITSTLGLYITITNTITSLSITITLVFNYPLLLLLP